MNRDRVSARQLYVLLGAAMLAPAARALPAWTAWAGEGAWLTGAAAFPVLLLEGWAVAALVRQGDSLAGAFEEALGVVAGKALTTLYMVWGLLLLCLEARLGAESFLGESYRGSGPGLFLAALLGLTAWLCRGKLGAFLRTAEIFYLALAAALGAVLVFSIVDMAPENVWPVWAGDLPKIFKAAAAPVGVLSAGVYGGFLWGAVEPEADRGRRGIMWLAWGCGVLALLQLGVLVQLGPELSGRLPSPFFEVARGIGASGAFRRVESVIVAVWLFSELAVLGLLAMALRAMAGQVWHRGEHWVPAAACLLALAGAMVLFPDGRAAAEAASGWVLRGNLVFGLVIPPVVLGVKRVRKNDE